MRDGIPNIVMYVIWLSQIGSSTTLSLPKEKEYFSSGGSPYESIFLQKQGRAPKLEILLLRSRRPVPTFSM